jgi:hypothetical protein
MLFCTRVLEFWVMKTTNIYDFLQLWNLIKIRPNVDLERNLTIAHICHNIIFFFKKNEKKAHIDKPNKKIKDTPWLPFICLFHLVSPN